MPSPISTDDIYVTLGSPWVPTYIIDDFIYYLVGEKFPSGAENRLCVRFDKDTGLWEIPNKGRFRYTKQSVKNHSTYGTKRMEMLYILENTLNMKTIAIHDTVPCPANKSGKATVINEAETVKALERQERMIEAFKKWVWTDKDRKDTLIRIYESKYSSIRNQQAYWTRHVTYTFRQSLLTKYLSRYMPPSTMVTGCRYGICATGPYCHYKRNPLFP